MNYWYALLYPSAFCSWVEGSNGCIPGIGHTQATTKGGGTHKGAGHTIQLCPCTSVLPFQVFPPGRRGEVEEGQQTEGSMVGSSLRGRWRALPSRTYGPSPLPLHVWLQDTEMYRQHNICTYIRQRLGKSLFEGTILGDHLQGFPP